MKVAQDKVRHYVGGVIISLMSVIVAMSVGVSLPWSCAIGIAAASTVGALKEYFDRLDRTHHTPDLFDWLATTLGGFTGAGIVVLLRVIAARLTLILLAASIAGCHGSRAAVLEAQRLGTAACVRGGPASVIGSIALYGTAAASLGLIVCGIAAIWLPDKLRVAKAAISCLAVIVTCQILYWLGNHLVLAACLSAGALAIAGALWLWAHRKQIERASGVDFNRDGKLG